ncbi:hypothetical protein [Brevundimonas sp.]
MAIRKKKAASTSVLVAVDNPCPALIPVVDELEALILPRLPKVRAFKAADLARFRTSLIALVKAIATNALATIPRHDGVNIAFGEGRYIGSQISPTQLRHIRAALYELDMIVVGKWFYSKDNSNKSYCTRIRHTEVFRDLCIRHGLKISDLIEPPSEVIAPIDGLTIPADVQATAATIYRYNDFIRDFQLTLSRENWIELESMVVKGATNGKGDKLHRGYNEGRIYLTRRFAETFDRGGRLYDIFPQGMPKVIRQRLRIDGEPTVELDFSRIHPTIIYADKGLPFDIDPYDVPGYPNMIEAGKELFNRLLNGQKKPTFRIKKDRKWFSGKDAFNAYRDAMIVHLSPIADTFSRDYGARLQKRDGNLCIAIIAACMAQGIPIYPIHDSFIVPRSYEETLRQIMINEFHNMFGTSIIIK